MQITLIGQDRFEGYPLWRQKTWRERVEREKEERELAKRENGSRPFKSRKELPPSVSDATIRTEMSIFRSIMAYAASKKYINESQIFKGKLPLAKVRPFEDGLLGYLRSKNSELLGTIRSSRDLSDDSASKLKSAVDGFAASFS